MPQPLVAPEVSSAERAPVSVDAIRWPERAILMFLVYAAALSVVLPAGATVRDRIVLLNWMVILAYGALIRYDFTNRNLVTGIIRDWLPLAAVVLAYREIGWLALPHTSHTLESHWIVWDRYILRGGARSAIEAFGQTVPAVLEISYALVYALAPFSVAVLYLYRRRERVDAFLLIFAVGVLLCYAQFPFWPSEPPRVVFSGQDFPAYDTVFRRFNLWMLGNYGIHTGVFPSAHVAGAFAAAFGMQRALPEHKWVGRFLFVVASLIAVATVYGRYHYAADATAGFAIAVVARAVCVRLRRG